MTGYQSTSEPELTEPVTVGFRESSVQPTVLVGGKGASLVRMTAAGLPVPPFFILTTKAWREWRANGTLANELTVEISERMKELERQTGKTFGGASHPLLVSVRSSGPVSMPGMMDTILNVGLSSLAFGGLVGESGSLHWASDLLSTLISSFPDATVPADATAQLLQAV